MFSAQLLKAAIHEAMIASFAQGNLLYFPLGSANATFAITDDYPSSEADFTVNRATMTVAGPISGAYPSNDTFASPVIQFTSYAIAQPDAQFLAEYVADWCLRLKETDIRMQTQCLNWVNVVRTPTPKRNSKNDLYYSSFDAQFMITVPNLRG